jgi:hypothetical protein
MSDLTTFGLSARIFLKVINIKFHENISDGSPADTCGRTDGRILKRIGAFRVNANAPKMVLQTRLCPKPVTVTCSSTRRWGDFYKEHFIKSQKFAQVIQKFPALYGILPARIHHWILP